MRSYSRAEQIRAEQLGRNGEEKGRSAPCAALGGFAAYWIAVGSLLPYGYHVPLGESYGVPLAGAFAAPQRPGRKYEDKKP